MLDIVKKAPDFLGLFETVKQASRMDRIRQFQKLPALVTNVVDNTEIPKDLAKGYINYEYNPSIDGIHSEVSGIYSDIYQACLEYKAPVETENKRLVPSKYHKGWLVLVDKLTGYEAEETSMIGVLDTEYFPYSKFEEYKESRRDRLLLAVLNVGNTFYVYAPILLSTKIDEELNYLPPMPKNLKVVVVHNLSAEKQFIRHSPDNLYLDTMSINMQLHGQASSQRARSEEYHSNLSDGYMDELDEDDGFILTSCGNSLQTIHSFYFPNEPELVKGMGEEIGKKGISMFMQGNVTTGYTLDTVMLMAAMCYCAKDVVATARVFEASFAKWVKSTGKYNRFQFNAWLIASTTALPIDKKLYIEQVQKVETSMEVSRYECNKYLLGLADKALEAGEKEQPCLEWRVVKSKKQPWNDKGILYPKWYCDYRKAEWEGESLLNKKTTTYLLRPTYLGEEVEYQERFLRTKSGLIKNFDPRSKTPYQTGLFTKHSIWRMEDGAVNSFAFDDALKPLVSAIAAMTNWISIRKRMLAAKIVTGLDGVDYIIPNTDVCGTVTRRTRESTFLVAPHPRKDKAGTEVRALVRAPEGYTFVEADVRSEEYVLFSLFGDSKYGWVGATGASVMALAGDIHNYAVGITKNRISRTAAKGQNYGRIYGQSKNGGANALYSSGGASSFEEAMELATVLFNATKGEKQGGQFVGGIESDAANKVLEYIKANVVVSPILGTKASEALQPYNVGDSTQHMLSNWVVQTSGSDFLFMFQSILQWHLSKKGIKAQLLLTQHDSFTWMCREEDGMELARLFNITHYHVWALICRQLGLDSVPAICAYFQEVQLDKIIRKDADKTGETPTYSGDTPGTKLTPKSFEYYS